MAQPEPDAKARPDRPKEGAGSSDRKVKNSRTNRIIRIYVTYSKAISELNKTLIDSSSFVRATKLGTYLIVWSIILSIGSSFSIFPMYFFSFPSVIADDMLKLGGVLIIVSVIGEVWNKNTIFREISKREEEVNSSEYYRMRRLLEVDPPQDDKPDGKGSAEN